MTNQVQVTLTHEQHRVLLTNWLRFAEIAPDNALIQMHASTYTQEDGAE